MNLVDPALAFLEGLALIVSPCILPVLPLVLSASVEGGRKRPFGIIIGFVIAFSLFVLGSRKLVSVFGIEPRLIQDVSLVLLALLGLVMLSSRLSAKFSELTQGLADAGGRLASGGGDGLLSGIIIGALIGLVWTPCAGPILAAVLVQVIRQETDLAGLLVILPFAIGASIPMLLIALAGRSAVKHMQFFAAHGERIRKVFGVLILLAVALIASGIDLASPLSRTEDASAYSDTLRDGVEKPYPAADFKGIDGWINSEPLTMASLRGKVVLIDFWTYSCINCIRTLPSLVEWDRKYRDKGLVIIGVHSPEFEFEKDRANVEAAVKQYGIEYPVALDNKLDTWTAFKNRAWPGHHLIDRNGNVVFVHYGESKRTLTENNIRVLLGLSKSAMVEPEARFNRAQTPETYLGYKRTRLFSSPEGMTRDAKAAYTLPQTLEPNGWALGGKWKIEGERIVAAEAGASLRLRLNAQKAFLVLGGNSVPVKLFLNGKPVTEAAGKDVRDSGFTIDQHRLYDLLDQREMKEGVIDIVAQAPGLEAYAFTFGR